MKRRTIWKKAIVWTVFCWAVGGIASWLTIDGIRKFDEIIKPKLTPPRIAFPIAWTILLLLMGVGFALVMHCAEDSSVQDRAVTAFAVQLTFFFCWMIWFFGLGWYGFAAIWLIGMLAAIAHMILVYRKISISAAWLQVPYFLWSILALYLNIGIWWLNR